MTTEFLSSLAGMALSLAASYLPGFSQWYATLEGPAKRLLMLGLLLAVALGVMGLACLEAGRYATWLGLGEISCTPAGALLVARVFVAALIANQATYSLSR